MSLRTFTLQMNLPTICLWVLLQRFIKSSIAFTNTAVVLHESTRAHVRKGGIASDKKNCIKAKKKKRKVKLKLFDWNTLIVHVDYLLTRMKSKSTWRGQYSYAEICGFLTTAEQSDLITEYVVYSFTNLANCFLFTSSQLNTRRKGEGIGRIWESHASPP